MHMTHTGPVEVQVLMGVQIGESFFLVSFFFSGHVHLHTLSTYTRMPPLHTPTLAWPGDEAPTPLPGFDDDNDDNSLHTHCMHHPPMSVSVRGLWSACNQPHSLTHKETVGIA